MLTVSIVSHGHGAMVADLLRDLEAVTVPLKVVLTLNVPEADPLAAASLRYPLRIIRNATPRGFGTNHNVAFRVAGPGTFCVLNPDVRLQGDPFPALLAELGDARVGAVAPKIVDPQGVMESTARRFPTPISILRKAAFGAPQAEYEIGTAPLAVDWVSGVCMVFSAEAFAHLKGFDERYYLYYEDVDLCARLRAEGRTVRLVPAAVMVHAARRDSHRDFRYMRWHLSSMLRFFLTRY